MGLDTRHEVDVLLYALHFLPTANSEVARAMNERDLLLAASLIRRAAMAISELRTA
jgi:hypothetical protein